MPVDVHDHREQRPVDPAASFGIRQLRDPQLQVARGRRERPRTAAVALRSAVHGAFPVAGADHRSELGSDQRLVDRLGRRADPVLDAPACMASSTSSWAGLCRAIVLQVLP